jgi:hypothetical protein
LRLSAASKAKTPVNDGVFQRNARENRKKPVETEVLPLTNAAESRTVKGGRFFRSRVNTGFCAG